MARQSGTILVALGWLALSSPSQGRLNGLRQSCDLSLRRNPMPCQGPHRYRRVLFR
jgi:hypothetical protein